MVPGCAHWAERQAHVRLHAAEPKLGAGRIAHGRAVMMSWVNTVSLPIRLAESPGAHDHCVPMDEPSAETDTTAIDRSLPSRASPNCSWSTSTMEATASSLTTSVTARGKLGRVLD